MKQPVAESTYYYIDSQGNIKETTSYALEEDYNRWTNFNAFPTKKAAMIERCKRKLYTIFIEHGGKTIHEIDGENRFTFGYNEMEKSLCFINQKNHLTNSCVYFI